LGRGIRGHADEVDEERQESNAKRRRIEDHRRQDESKARKQGTTVLNGQEYVAVTPAATARGGPLHPSLPQRPGFDLVPKEEITIGTAQPVGPAKKLTKTEREAESIKQGLAALQGSNEDIVKNRRAIRMANLSAAEKLKAELEGRTLPEEQGEKTGQESVVLERTEDEEKVEMTREEAREVLEEQGEADGVDEEVIPPAIRADSEDGEAEVERPGDEPMENDEEEEGEGIIEAPSRASQIDVDEIDRDEGLDKKEKKRRGKKRKFDEAGEDLGSSGSDDEAPPNPEADQPVPKKKLKFNSDGTVEGYVDDVR
jgi:5'-3' exoribonuclease 2